MRAKAGLGNERQAKVDGNKAKAAACIEWAGEIDQYPAMSGFQNKQTILAPVWNLTVFGRKGRRDDRSGPVFGKAAKAALLAIGRDNQGIKILCSLLCCRAIIRPDGAINSRAISLAI